MRQIAPYSPLWLRRDPRLRSVVAGSHEKAAGGTAPRQLSDLYCGTLIVHVDVCCVGGVQRDAGRAGFHDRSL